MTATKDMIAEGVAALDASAQAAGFADYLSVGWESDRVKLLTAMEETGFFQTIRGGSGNRACTTKKQFGRFLATRASPFLRAGTYRPRF